MGLIETGVADQTALLPSGHCGVTRQIGDIAGGQLVIDIESLEDAGVGGECVGSPLIQFFELAPVLQEGPYLQTEARHETHSGFDHWEIADRRELVEDE